VDVLKFYANGSEMLDFSDPANLSTGDPAELTLAHFLRDNLKRAITLE
jgi:hypothetical protein